MQPFSIRIDDLLCSLDAKSRENVKDKDLVNILEEQLAIEKNDKQEMSKALESARLTISNMHDEVESSMAQLHVVQQELQKTSLADDSKQHEIDSLVIELARQESVLLAKSHEINNLKYICEGCHAESKTSLAQLQEVQEKLEEYEALNVLQSELLASHESQQKRVQMLLGISIAK